MREKAMMRPPMEEAYKEELEALALSDTGKRPVGWKLSPRAVRTFILGSSQPIEYNGKQVEIRKKYYGNDGLIFAKLGFNVIGTANTRDKGVNEMSSALKRRFNFETVEPVREVKLEKQIILQEVEKLAAENLVEMEADEAAAEVLASTYHELREGVSSMGHQIDKPSAVMSTAEAVSVYYQTMMSAYYYGDSVISMDAMVQNLVGAVVKENKDDLPKIRSYFQTVIRDKSQKEGDIWKAYYEAKKYLG